jgi:hypothetical protein
MKSIIQTIFIFLLFCVVACKNKEVSAELLNGNVPADFLDFYDRFSNDTVFQLQSIVFPLEGRPSFKDGVDSIPVDFKWQKETWYIHKPYSDPQGTFTRTFTVFNDIVSEDIRDDSGQFTMIRRFARTSDGWKLIYFKEMGL